MRYMFFFNDTATTEIYTLSLHDALPISRRRDSAGGGVGALGQRDRFVNADVGLGDAAVLAAQERVDEGDELDRKSTRLNSSHANISYAVFCLKKNKSVRSPPSDTNSDPT